MNKNELKNRITNCTTMEELKKTYHELLKIVHPDNENGSEELTLYLFELYDKQVIDIENGNVTKKENAFYSNEKHCKTYKDFTDLNGEEQIEIIKRMINHVIDMLHAWKPKTAQLTDKKTELKNDTSYHGLHYGDFARKTKDGMLSAVNMAWIKLFDFNNKYANDLPFSIILYKACKSALYNINYSEKKHDTCIGIATNEDIEKYNYNVGQDVISIDTYECKPSIEYDTEKNAVLNIMLENICHDETDKIIIENKLNGKTQTEISKMLNLSVMAISKRLKNMEKRYHEHKENSVIYVHPTIEKIDGETIKANNGNTNNVCFRKPSKADKRYQNIDTVLVGHSTIENANRIKAENANRENANRIKAENDKIRRFNVLNAMHCFNVSNASIEKWIHNRFTFNEDVTAKF